MKRYLGLTALILTVMAAAPAQESTGTHVVVPSRNPSRPRTVKISTVNSSITVRTHAGTDVIVETEGGRSRGRQLPDRTADGLHRIDLPAEMTVSEEGDVINVRPPLSGGTVILTVPVNTSLQLKSVRGPIRVDGVHGEVDATATNGSLELTNVAGTIVADTTNGSITASMDQVDQSKPISFSSVNGSVNVTLPADLKANVKMRTLNGGVWSAFEIKMNGGLTLQHGGTMTGTINGGGVEANFTTLNGRIEIRKK
jgi:Putative adhesin